MTGTEVSLFVEGATRAPDEPTANPSALGGTVWWRTVNPRGVRIVSGEACNGCSSQSDLPFWAAAWDGSELLGFDTGSGSDPVELGPFDRVVDIQIGSPLGGYLMLTGSEWFSANTPYDTPATAKEIGTWRWPSDNATATAEPGEMIGGLPGRRSIWGTWTAPLSGTVVITTEGSNFPTRMSVWRGTQPQGAPVCSTGPLGGRNWAECALKVDDGDRLIIGIDGVGNAHGMATVSAREVLATPRGTTPGAAPTTAPVTSTSRPRTPSAGGSPGGGRQPAPATPVGTGPAITTTTTTLP